MAPKLGAPSPDSSQPRTSSPPRRCTECPDDPVYPPARAQLGDLAEAQERAVGIAAIPSRTAPERERYSVRGLVAARRRTVRFTNTTTSYSTVSQLWWMCRPYILGRKSGLIHSLPRSGACRGSPGRKSRRNSGLRPRRRASITEVNDRVAHRLRDAMSDDYGALRARYRSLCVLVISWVQGVSDLYPIDRICPPEGSQYLRERGTRRGSRDGGP